LDKNWVFINECLQKVLFEDDTMRCVYHEPCRHEDCCNWEHCCYKDDIEKDCKESFINKPRLIVRFSNWVQNGLKSEKPCVDRFVDKKECNKRGS
jgi:hypothetical protein